MSNVRNVTDDDFAEAVLGSDGPFVVDFFASWCGPCKLIAPEIEKLAAKYAGKVDVVKLDVDANPETSHRLKIMSIPTIAIFRPGEEPRAVLGFRRLAQLEEAFELDIAA